MTQQHKNKLQVPPGLACPFIVSSFLRRDWVGLNKGGYTLSALKGRGLHPGQLFCVMRELRQCRRRNGPTAAFARHERVQRGGFC